MVFGRLFLVKKHTIMTSCDDKKHHTQKNVFKNSRVPQIRNHSYNLVNHRKVERSNLAPKRLVTLTTQAPFYFRKDKNFQLHVLQGKLDWLVSAYDSRSTRVPIINITDRPLDPCRIKAVLISFGKSESFVNENNWWSNSLTYSSSSLPKAMRQHSPFPNLLTICWQE